MAAEIIIVLYVSIVGLLGSVFLLDFLWSRKSDEIQRGIQRVEHK